jgi:hypothetical protein
MMRRAELRSSWKGLAIATIALGFVNAEAEAQGKKERGRSAAVAEVAFSVDAGMEKLIRAFYGERPAFGVEALPPGIRRNLARGKPLPPGIAKRSAPPELVSTLALPRGYELVEVGLDVFVVEVATAVIHDVLMDVIR